MAYIKDFISSSSNENTASLAYLLLMANVLGLAIFIECKPKQNKHFEEPFSKTIIPTNETDTVSDNNIVEQENNVEEVDNLNDNPKIEDHVIDIVPKKVAKQENEEKSKMRDNVINFEDAVALKTHETKPVLKPLKWNFPKK